jgi:hypothetical protein
MPDFAFGFGKLLVNNAGQQVADLTVCCRLFVVIGLDVGVHFVAKIYFVLQFYPHLKKRISNLDKQERDSTDGVCVFF